MIHNTEIKGGDNMPRRDQTGPDGRGPITGRGLGPCSRGSGLGRGIGRRANY